MIKSLEQRWYFGAPILIKHSMVILRNVENWTDSCATEVVPHIVVAITTSDELLQYCSLGILGTVLTSCPSVCPIFVDRKGVQPLLAQGSQLCKWSQMVAQLPQSLNDH